MENNADLHDWELLQASDFTDNYVFVAVLDENSPNIAIKDDYFAFDSNNSQNLQSEESEEGGVDSDNPSCPNSDSNPVFETAEEHLGFANSGGFLSDESSDGRRSLGNSEDSVMEMGSEEMGEIGGREMNFCGFLLNESSDGRRLLDNSEHSVMKMGSEEIGVGEMNFCGFLLNESSDGKRLLDNSEHSVMKTGSEEMAEIGVSEMNFCGFLSDESSDGRRLLGNSEHSVMKMGSEEMEEIGVREMNFCGFLSDQSDGRRLLANSEHSVMEIGSEESDSGCDRSDSREMREIGCVGDINEVEKREKMWWKVPLGLLKYCFVGMRPVWSLSICAALVGLVMLWRKLYRMKQKSRSIPLKLAVDDKKTSQFAARSARLNAAFSVVRRMPAIRPFLQEGVATQWAALPLR